MGAVVGRNGVVGMLIKLEINEKDVWKCTSY